MFRHAIRPDIVLVSRFCARHTSVKPNHFIECQTNQIYVQYVMVSYSDTFLVTGFGFVAGSEKPVLIRSVAEGLLHTLFIILYIIIC